MSEIINLSASKIKVLNNCSWLFYCNYILKLSSPKNSGSSRGICVHALFECLLNPRHKKHFDKLIKKQNINGSKAVKKLCLKLAKKLDVADAENLKMIHEMLFVGLNNDFYSLGSTKIQSELDFNIQLDKTVAINGFIDKMSFYPDGTAQVLDFKSSKKVFTKEELENDLQVLMYSLACWLKFGIIPKVTFLFLRFPKNPRQEAAQLTESALKGFQIYLKQLVNLIKDFDEKRAVSQLAADNPKTRWLCGFNYKKGQLKKDGEEMWGCAFKFPFNYFALVDKNDKVIKTSMENDLVAKDGEKIVEKKYCGCPKYNYTSNSVKITSNDDFDF